MLKLYSAVLYAAFIWDKIGLKQFLLAHTVIFALWLANAAVKAFLEVMKQERAKTKVKA